MSFFREITISGNAAERGSQYGEKLASEISETIAYYREIFNLPDTEILGLAEKFRSIIEDFNAGYMIEINALAQAARLDPLWIVALNARTEILSHGGLEKNPALQATECTSLCFPDACILGQTWDWGKPMEALTVILRIIHEDGHVITTLSEAGIIGKIGMNNAGLGVCLNILALGEKLDGVPIHILLRGILDCRSIDNARTLVTKNGSGKSSNILVGDDKGNCFDTEFAGHDTFRLSPADGNNDSSGVFVHTNHYLGKQINSPDDPLFNSSYARFAKASERSKTKTGKPLSTMMAILSDRSNPEHPIFRPYIPDVSLKELGTVFTIAMDLSAREMHLRKGADQQAPFKIYKAG